MIYEAPESVLEVIGNNVVDPSNGGPIVLPDQDLNG